MKRGKDYIGVGVGIIVFNDREFTFEAEHLYDHNVWDTHTLMRTRGEESSVRLRQEKECGKSHE